MKKLIIAAVFLFSLCSLVFAKGDCVANARTVEPVLSESAYREFQAKLIIAEVNLVGSPDDADAIIWFGRRTAYVGNYKQAIGIFTKGIEKHPKDARMYRHRGHRFITIRCFDDAIKDFQTAAKLIKGKPDEIEPDGLPNDRNLPTSTLQSNIWYHLGLTYYLKGDFKNSLKAYKKCLKVSKNPDMLVATTHWLYMTLRRMGRAVESEKAISQIKADLDIIENDDYYKLIKLYQGKLKPDDLLKEFGKDTDTLGSASLGYGLGNWFAYNGDEEKAEAIFRRITQGDQWASFGYIAAETELANP